MTAKELEEQGRETVHYFVGLRPDAIFEDEKMYISRSFAHVIAITPDKDPEWETRDCASVLAFDTREAAEMYATQYNTERLGDKKETCGFPMDDKVEIARGCAYLDAFRYTLFKEKMEWFQNQCDMARTFVEKDKLQMKQAQAIKDKKDMASIRSIASEGRMVAEKAGIDRTGTYSQGR